ncbi:MAG: winged helix-turn-helix domain-containing protein [Chromatiales bacterium]|nr:winged helix-turn-helix domain-containing protein [Chromatiales bacterium]
MATEAGIENNAAQILPSPRHADIAARVGTHREGVTRELNELQRMGLVDRRAGDGARALVVTDVQRLRQLLE